MKPNPDKFIWQLNSYNVRGQVTNYLLGDDYRTIRDWDYYGFPEHMLTQTTGSPPVVKQNEDYNFDELKGNLLSRTDYLPYNKSETFEYDDLNRLTHVSSVNYSQFHTTFAPNGNITQKTDIGTYTYGAAGPHAVTGLTNTTGNLLPATDQTVDYTAFNKASYIGQGNYDYLITYGPDRQRSRTVLMDGISEATLLTKYYAFGDYEKEITEDGTRHLHYISGGDGLAAIYVEYSNAPDSLYFILKDHLGSIIGAINSETGTFYRQSFDACSVTSGFGFANSPNPMVELIPPEVRMRERRKRNPQTWSYRMTNFYNKGITNVPQIVPPIKNPLLKYYITAD